MRAAAILIAYGALLMALPAFGQTPRAVSPSQPSSSLSLLPKLEPPDPPLSNAQVARNFDIIAFGNEYTHKRYDAVRKWQRPLRVGINGKSPAWFDDMVVQFLDELIAITGHPMGLVYTYTLASQKRLPSGFDPKSVNVFLMFMPINEMAKHLPDAQFPDKAQIMALLNSGKATCFAKLFKKGDEIRSAVVLFPSHYDERTLRACIVEELTQILGLPNDSDQVQQSIFVDKGKYNELTPQDRLLLRILYDPNIKIGMPRQQAVRTALEILKRLRPGR